MVLSPAIVNGFAVLHVIAAGDIDGGAPAFNGASGGNNPRRVLAIIVVVGHGGTTLYIKTVLWAEAVLRSSVPLLLG